MWGPNTSGDILKSLRRHHVLERAEVSISDVILLQSWFVFRETELKHVTTLALPHPVCVRYTERSRTVSSFSETEVIDWGPPGRRGWAQASRVG